LLDAAREVKDAGQFTFLDGCVTTPERNKLARQSAAVSFRAEAGKVYYIRTTILEITHLQTIPGMKLELIDGAEGQLLISSSALSTAHPRK
jgi:hypothetical protein